MGAIPNTGYHLDRWVGCTSVSGITCYVKMDSNKTVTAYFLPDTSSYELTVIKNGLGTIISSPSGVSCGSNCTKHNSGTGVTLMATLKPGYTVNWTGCESALGNTCKVTMNGNKTVIAYFISNNSNIDSDNDGILDNKDKCPATHLSDRPVNGVGCPIPSGSFNIKPTSNSLSDSDLGSVANVEIGNQNEGKIKWNEEVSLILNNGRKLNLDSVITITNHRVKVDSTIAPNLNRRATITLYGLNINNSDDIRILRDGFACSDCAIDSYSNGTLIFSVPGFSEYTVVENEAPTISAGSNKNITSTSNQISLSGSANDSEENPMTFAWSVVSGDGTVTFSKANSLNTTATFSRSGSYKLRLTVTDSYGGVSTDDINVTVTISGSDSNSSGGSRTNRQSNSTNNTDQINNQSVINIIRTLFASGILTKQQHDIVIAVLSSSGGTVTQQQTSSGSTSCLILTKVMYRGLRDQNTNGEVTKLQRFLVSKGYLSSTFNSFGSFDLLTENALKRFQVDYKVVSGPNAKGAGGIGPITQNKIKELTCQ